MQHPNATYPPKHNSILLDFYLPAQKPIVLSLTSCSIPFTNPLNSSGLSSKETNMPPSICHATWQCSAHTPGLSATNRSTTCHCAGTVTVSRRMGLSRDQVVCGLLPPENSPGPQATIWKECPLVRGSVMVVEGRREMGGEEENVLQVERMLHHIPTVDCNLHPLIRIGK